MQISWLVIHQDCLHAALEGTLGGREQCLEEIPCIQKKKQKHKIKLYYGFFYYYKWQRVGDE